MYFNVSKQTRAHVHIFQVTFLRSILIVAAYRLNAKYKFARARDKEERDYTSENR